LALSSAPTCAVRDTVQLRTLHPQAPSGSTMNAYSSLISGGAGNFKIDF
jgi:hypothetical protein